MGGSDNGMNDNESNRATFRWRGTDQEIEAEESETLNNGYEHSPVLAFVLLTPYPCFWFRPLLAETKLF